MKSAKRRAVLGSLVCGAMFASLTVLPSLAHASKDKPEIGFCIDDLRVERWSRDRDYFVAAATKLGAKVSVQSADASEERQISQIENLISPGVDVIVIVPFNSKRLGNVVAEAKKAGGAIQALAGQRLAGKVPISGQDADLAAVKRLVGGTQTMTVYKPLKLIAGEAAKLAVDLAKGQQPAYNAKYDNGMKQVNTVLLQPTLLTKSNVDAVVKDGFYTQAQLAGN